MFIWLDFAEGGVGNVLVVLILFIFMTEVWKVIFLKIEIYER
jgi:hypothetical protein